MRRLLPIAAVLALAVGTAAASEVRGAAGGSTASDRTSDAGAPATSELIGAAGGSTASDRTSDAGTAATSELIGAAGGSTASDRTSDAGAPATSELIGAAGGSTASDRASDAGTAATSETRGAAGGTTAGKATRAQAPTPYAAALHVTRTIGSRAAASPGELRAQRYAAAAFRAAGLRIGWERFTVPGRGRSRDVIGILDTPARCLTILMAHSDTGPGLPGANDNASGSGVVIALAARLAADAPPPCDTWLVLTGAEERFVTGTPDHLGASALVRRVTRLKRRSDLGIALSLDEVGRGGRFYLQSPNPRSRPAVEGKVQRAAQATGTAVRFAPDAGDGNSDHREFELSGLPAAKLGPRQAAEPCRHRPCDRWQRLDRATLNAAAEIAARVARDANAAR